MATLLFLTTVVLVLFSEGQLGNLWCHEGGKKIYSPTQCISQTLECFKFICEHSQSGFTARGCGVSLLTTTGLPNESCHQAMEMCESLRGVSTCLTCNKKHMCNFASISQIWMIFCFSFYFLIHICSTN